MWSQAEVGRDPRTGEPLGMTGTWAQVNDVKWGAIGRGKAVTGSREEILGPPDMGEKCRRAVEADRRGRLPGGLSLHARAR